MSEDTSDPNEKIEVLRGAENIIDRTLRDLVDVRQTFDNCTDYTGPSVFLAYQPVWDACIALKQEGIRLRFITEITKDNINMFSASRCNLFAFRKMTFTNSCCSAPVILCLRISDKLSIGCKGVRSSWAATLMN